MPDGNILFANAFRAGTTFLFDVTRPRKPIVASSFVERGAYTFLHSSERLPNGNVLATFQNRRGRETWSRVGSSSSIKKDAI